MKKLLGSVPARIVTAAIAFILIAVAVVFVIRDKGTNQKSEQVPVQTELATIDDGEVPLADAPSVESTENDKSEDLPDESATVEETTNNQATERSDNKQANKVSTVKTQNSTTAQNIEKTSTATSITNVVKTANNSSGSSVDQTNNKASTTELNNDNRSNDTNKNDDASNSGSNGGNTSSGSNTPSSVEKSEAETYFSESGKLVRIIDVKQSEGTLNEVEADELLKERGFDVYPIAYQYDIDGNYLGTKEATGNISNYSPAYQTYFINDNNEFWTIYVVNGQVMAYPVSYNLESPHSVELLIAESNELTSYDSITNKYYVNIPNGSTAILKVIDRIDAARLNEITSGEIDGL